MIVKRALIGLAVIALLLVSGCGSTPSGTTNIKGSADMFKEGGKGSLTIKNNANFDVIIFAGNVNQNNVLGGIRAGRTRSFDISTLNLPAKNGSFLVRAASFQKSSGKNFRIKEEDVLYTGLVVYDLNNPRDKTELDIYSGIIEDGEFIYVSNRSKFVLELRLGTPNGEKLATLPPLLENKKIFLSKLDDGMEHIFYATYVYIDPSNNEIKSFAAKDRSERQRRIPGFDVNPILFEGPKTTTDIAYQVAFLRIKNDASQGFNLMDGTRRLPDQKGRRLVASGEQQTFEIAATSVGGQLYTNINMEFDNTSVLRMNNFTVRPGVVYDCSITESNGNFKYDIKETAYKDRLEDMQISLFLGN